MVWWCLELVKLYVLFSPVRGIKTVNMLKANMLLSITLTVVAYPKSTRQKISWEILYNVNITLTK